MKMLKNSLITLLLLASVLGMALRFLPMPISQASMTSPIFGNIQMAKPWFFARGLVVVFVDTQQFAANDLAKQIATKGAAVAVIDSAIVIPTLAKQGKDCLDDERLIEPLQTLASWSGARADDRRLIAGMGKGALLALLASANKTKTDIQYLSVGFSAVLPSAISVCQPFAVHAQSQQTILTVSSDLNNHWRSVWTDQPDSDTALLIRTLGHTDTAIAPYDTPLDKLTVTEISRILGQGVTSVSDLPVVELPALKPNNTVTLFYSGDGGWRDLDRTVAEEMVKLDYPVVGVDVLRYFWVHKSPEQAAADLTKALAYYRKNWGATQFVLAGYSFGADILPAVFNRLSNQDQQAVAVLVLLAPAEQASFEIHVSGWLGQDSGEHALAPELAQIPKHKLLCIYGQEEKDERGCAGLNNTDAKVIELPGGHHFDEDYAKLASQIVAFYHQHGIN